MSEFGQIIEDKCMNFAVRIVNLCKFLREEKNEFNISNQLFRSGTSIGANMAEAQAAISKRDFIAKAYIALKESRETIYWITLLYRTQEIVEKQYLSIFHDAEELRKLLTSITMTARKNESDGKDKPVQ